MSTTAILSGRYLSIFTLTAAMAICQVRSALAVEGGTTSYPGGLETAYTGVVPAPGTTQLDAYALGFAAPGFNGSNGQNVSPGFSLTGQGFAFRIWHTWDFSLAGFHLTTAIDPIPMNNIHIVMDGKSYHSTGPEEMLLEPTDISRRFGNVSMTLNELIYLPMGQRTLDNPASTGAEAATFATSLGFSWFPGKWDISTYSLFATSAYDHRTNYQSGNYIDIDYGVTYRPFDRLPRLALGLNGFYQDQLTDDTQNGVSYNNGNRLMVFALGPMVEWDFTSATAILFKWQHELVARNTISGERFWVMFATPLSL